MKKIKYLLFIIPLLLIFTSQVNAVAVGDYSFIGHKVDDEFTISSGGSITGPISFFNTAGNSNNSSAFAYVDVCTNGTMPTLWITSNSTGSLIPSTKWYQVNTRCCVMGDCNASVYRQIMFISSSEYSPTCNVDSSGSTSSVPCTRNSATGRLFSNTNWNIVMRILHFGLTEEIPLNDLIYENDLTQTDVLKDILSSIQSSSTEQTNAIKEQTEKIEEQIEKTEEINNSINNSDTTDASNSASGFFDNFEDDDFGLSGVISAPLQLINRITSNSCSSLTLQIPFVNKTLTLPCMNSIYQDFFGSFLTIYQTITFGIVAYWVCVQIYALVKNFKNPDKDEIEVLDL